MARENLAEVLEEIAQLLELKAKNPFKIRAYRQSAETVRNCDGDIAELADKNELTGIKGIGDALRDNLMPYALTGHLHEREIGHKLGRPVRFMPHVAAFFRGITLTIDCELANASTAGELEARFRAFYEGERLVSVQAEAPLVRDAVGMNGVSVGGFSCAGTRAVIVATIDNLLKGAATQALQNANLALGLPEFLGIDSPQP